MTKQDFYNLLSDVIINAPDHAPIMNDETMMKAHTATTKKLKDNELPANKRS